MCEWGNTKMLRVLVPAHLSHTGVSYWAVKPIDACLAGIVEVLNAAGIYTACCCCGHGKKTGSIILHDGRELLMGANLGGLIQRLLIMSPLNKLSEGDKLILAGQLAGAMQEAIRLSQGMPTKTEIAEANGS